MVSECIRSNSPNFSQHLHPFAEDFEIRLGRLLVLQSRTRSLVIVAHFAAGNCSDVTASMREIDGALIPVLAVRNATAVELVGEIGVTA